MARTSISLDLASIGKKYTSRLDIALLALLALALFIAAVGHVRFVRDDITNVYSLWDMIHDQTLGHVLASIATNAWNGIRRSYFLTWWLQLLLIYVFRPADPLTLATVFFCLIFLVHFANALLVRWLMFWLFGDRIVALATAAAYLYMPHAVESYFVSNNWFFILPLFFLLLFLRIWATWKPLTIHSFLAASGTLLLSMFSGEQLLATPFAVGVSSSLLLFAFKPANWQRILLHSLAVFGFVALVFVVYLYGISISPPDDPLRQVSPSILSWNTIDILRNYNDQLEYQTKAMFTIDAWPYGSGDIAISKMTIGFAIAAAAVFVAFLCATSRMSAAASWRSVILSIAMFAAAALGILIPMYSAAILGVRPGPDTRYLLSPTLLLLMTAFALLAPLPRLIRLAASSVIFSYLALLTFHLVLDVWPAQAPIDRRLWLAVESAIRPQTDYVLTLNNDPSINYLMPAWQTVAWSDFGADWAPRSRLSHMFGRPIIVIRRVEPLPDGSVQVEDYYGNKQVTTSAHIAVIYFDSGRTFAETAKGRAITMSYDEYLERRKDLKIPEKPPR